MGLIHADTAELRSLAQYFAKTEEALTANVDALQGRLRDLLECSQAPVMAESADMLTSIIRSLSQEINEIAASRSRIETYATRLEEYLEIDGGGSAVVSVEKKITLSDGDTIAPVLKLMTAVWASKDGVLALFSSEVTAKASKTGVSVSGEVSLFEVNVGTRKEPEKVQIKLMGAGAEASIGRSGLKLGAGVNFASAEARLGKIKLKNHDIQLKAEVGLKFELGVSLGKETEIKLPFISYSVDFKGRKKRSA